MSTPSTTSLSTSPFFAIQNLLLWGEIFNEDSWFNLSFPLARIFMLVHSFLSELQPSACPLSTCSSGEAIHIHSAVQMLRGDHCLWSWELDDKLVWLQTLPDDLQQFAGINQGSWCRVTQEGFMTCWCSSKLCQAVPITWDESNIQLNTAFSFIFIYWICHAENMGKAISMTLNLKVVWGNMPPSPLVWSPKGTVNFLLMCTPSKSDTTPLQRLDAVTQSLFSGLESNFKVKSPSKIQWNEAIFFSSPG